jgi:uncharacterized membrane protein YhhN
LTPDRTRFPSRREAALLALALAAAVAWPIVDRDGAAGGALLLVKTTPVAALALLAFGRRRELAGGALLAGALAAHAAGDLLLEVAFLGGVAAFLCGHLGYLRLFWRERRPAAELGGGTKLALGLLALAVAGFASLLAPRLEAGALRVAIPLYVAALVSMAGSALLSRRGRPWIPAGALLFVASDALLAFGMFGRLPSGASRLVWPLYVIAQLMIALGWIARGAERGSARAWPRPAP